MADLDPFDEYGFEGEDDASPSTASGVLAAIKDAEKQFDRWQHKCDRIDKLYSSLQSLAGGGIESDGRLQDREYNLFWASVEVIKPSIYSRPPVPVVVPKFKDRNAVKRTTSELLERTCIAGFDASDIDQVMLGVRDDLVISARGVIWLSYETTEESDSDYEKVCIEHLDRTDFLHEPARKWSEVGWVARRAWLTQRQVRKRFGRDISDELTYSKRKEPRDDGAEDIVLKTGIWEVWSKTDKKVYWVAEDYEEFLDDDNPHLKLEGFFPCPRPAYGTLQRRTLVPVPDISYIEDQLETINELTVRIHDLCDKLVVKGLIPAGTDAGDAVEMAMREESASYMLIPVPSMTLTQGSEVQWLPIDLVAQAILSAVEARHEIIDNVQQLLGVSDIQRADTQAEETLGAQKLKIQQGSVRIRDRVGELVRIARDAVRIMSEIMAEEFDLDTLFAMSQMELPTNAEIKKQIRTLEDAAKKDLGKIEQQFEALAEDPEAQQNPQQVQEQLQQAIAQVTGKYGPQIEKLGATVTEEQVKDLLRDDKTRCFVFDIETDSTIYPDEQAEKQSRNEFMTAFTTAATALAPLVATGPAGAKMAGELIKFQLGPYRAGRQLEGMIDEWVESLANMPQQDNGAAEAQQALAQSQLKLAEAEGIKSQAAMANVQAKAAKDQAENERKMMELQQKAYDAQNKFAAETATLEGKLAEQGAKINLMQAQTAEILNSIGLDVRKQDLEEYKAAEQTHQNAIQNVQSAETTAFDQSQQLESNQRADRGEDRADRSQYFAERTAESGNEA